MQNNLTVTESLIVGASTLAGVAFGLSVGRLNPYFAASAGMLGGLVLGTSYSSVHGTPNTTGDDILLSGLVTGSAMGVIGWLTGAARQTVAAPLMGGLAGAAVGYKIVDVLRGNSISVTFSANESPSHGLSVATKTAPIVSVKT